MTTSRAPLPEPPGSPHPAGSGPRTGSSTDPVVIGSPPLEGLTTSLFVQAMCAGHTGVTELMDRVGVGVVYTMNGNTRSPMHPGAAVDYTRRRVEEPNILVDRGLYAGPKRKKAGKDISSSWISFQRSTLGLPWALTDSGYCGKGDRKGLRDLLGTASRITGDVIVVLPVAPEWLIDDATELRAEIDSQDHPVALVLEDRRDPCGRRGLVKGLVEVLRAEAPVGLLRADTSAIGALANGATIGAVGTTSALRHIYPITRGGGGGTAPDAMVVPALLSYHHLHRVSDASTRNPGLRAWDCGCEFCAVRGDITWIPLEPDPATTAFQHSVAALSSIGRQLQEAADPAAKWIHLCMAAQTEYFSITAGEDWSPKPFLARWLDTEPSHTGV